MRFQSNAEHERARWKRRASSLGHRSRDGGESQNPHREPLLWLHRRRRLQLRRRARVSRAAILGPPQISADFSFLAFQQSGKICVICGFNLYFIAVRSHSCHRSIPANIGTESETFRSWSRRKYLPKSFAACVLLIG